MKLLILKIGLLIGLGGLYSASSMATGIPTADIATFTQLQAEALQQAARWAQTVEQYKNELTTQQNTLASLTGVTDIGSFMDEAQGYFNDSKELASWINNPQKILDNGLDSLSSELKAIYKEYNLDETCKAYENSTNEIVEKQRKNCEGEIILMTLRQQQNANTLKTVDERVGTINKIAKKMQTAKTTKESTDLGNALNVQVAQLQAEKLKMDLQMQTEQQQEKLIEKREDDLFKQQLEENRPSKNSMGWD